MLRSLHIVVSLSLISESLRITEVLWLLLLFFFKFCTSSRSVFFSYSVVSILVVASASAILDIIIVWSKSSSVLNVVGFSKWRSLSVLALGTVLGAQVCSWELGGLHSLGRFSVGEISGVLNSALNFVLTPSDNIINFASDLFNLSFSVESFSHLVICLNESFQLFLQAVVLIV